MKKCPQCGREYDNTMAFCLDDGAELLYGPAGMEEPATVLFHSQMSGGQKDPGNLPAERTRFVGRAKELDTYIALATETRLLTITGFGGCGRPGCVECGRDYQADNYSTLELGGTR